MALIGTYRKKTCTKCFKYLKVYLTCFKCDAVYHAKCLLKVPGFQVDQDGHAFCCRNRVSTFKSDPGKEILASQERLVIVKQEEEYDSNKAHLVCSFCDEENFQEESYEQHIKRCEEYYSQLNKANDVRITSTKRKEAHVHTNERLFKCHSCSYTTIRRNNLNSHILAKHSNAEKKYKCSDCNYSAHQKSKLVKHTLIHTNDKPFKCDTCDYAAIWRRELNVHILRKHSDAEKMYKCGDCKYSTYQKSSLVRHGRSHTDERPFKCDACDYAAARRSNLNSHILAKHSNVEKKHKCGYCQYSSHQKSKLIKHIRVHTNERPFKCDTCDYAATSSAGLSNHVLVKHSNGEKKYKCSDCEYSTQQKCILVAHARIHTNEKPFKCDTCDYAAARKDNLKAHILARHSNPANT